MALFEHDAMSGLSQPATLPSATTLEQQLRNWVDLRIFVNLVRGSAAAPGSAWRYDHASFDVMAPAIGRPALLMERSEPWGSRTGGNAYWCHTTDRRRAPLELWHFAPPRRTMARLCR